MRKLISIFVFSAALFVGVFSSPMHKPTIYEKLYPVFSQDEINSLVGKKVTNKAVAGRLCVLKSTWDTKGVLNFEFVQDGETGTIVDIRNETSEKDLLMLQKTRRNCNLVVKWDKKNKDGGDMYSCNSRFSSRVFLKFE